MNYLFWALCALIIVIALLFVVLPLWRNSSRNNDVLRDAANLEILRDQVTEMDTDLRNGLLNQELYEQGKSEIKARLLEEVKATMQSVSQSSSNKILATSLAILLPVFSLSLYLYLGNYNAALPLDEKVVADSNGIIHSEQGIRALESQLKNRPEDPNGWFMLASSYIAKNRYKDAAVVYEKIVELVPDDAQVWANYADIYAMAHGKSLQGERVAGYLKKALVLDANNITALALSGTASMQSGDYASAIIFWQNLVSKMEPDSLGKQRFEANIQRASQLLSEQPGGNEKLARLMAEKNQAVAATAVSGKVALSPGLANKAAPTDTVFILARAAQGPKMPLAVFRKQVKDLPLEFTLDDTMAMQPQLKLSGFEQIVVVARVSKSGTPMSQPGDIEGMSGPIKPGTKGLKIVIDTVVP